MILLSFGLILQILLYENIKFTIEKEENNQIVFLDVLVTRTNNTLLTSVYFKPTNQYLNFRSNHHPRIKYGVIKCLTQRAKKHLCSTSPTRRNGYTRKSFIAANGYPSRRVDEVMKHRQKQCDEEQDESEDQVINTSLCPRTK